MTPEELADRDKQRAWDAEQSAARREFYKWLIDKLVTALPGIVATVLAAITTYYSISNATDLQTAAKARVEIEQKIDQNHTAATQAIVKAEEAVKTTAEKADAIASKVDVAVEHVKMITDKPATP